MVHAMLKILIVATSAWVVVHFLSEDEINYTNLLAGKNVLLTGASSGIGEEAAYYYAKLGANVVIAARRESFLQKVVAKCKELSPSAKFKYIVADFSKDDVPEKVVSEAVSFLGSLDYLLLNHAYLMTSKDEVKKWTGSKDQYERLKYAMDVNFLSYVKTSDAALPHLKKRNGGICVISSMIILRPMFVMPYSASKSAMSSFFTGLREEVIYRHDNVSVTIIHLGFVHTEHSDDSLDAMSLATGKDLKRQISILPITSPAKCAKDIIEAFTRREEDVYYPYDSMLWLLKIIRILMKYPDGDAHRIDNTIEFLVNIKESIWG